MSALQIAVLALAAILINLMKRGRSLALLGASTLVIYWLQPAQSPANLMFWLPTLTLLLTILCWSVISKPEVRTWRKNWGAYAVLVIMVIVVDLNRYIQIEGFSTETPRFHLVIVAIAGISIAGVILTWLGKYTSVLIWFFGVGLVALLVLLKTPSGFERVFETVAEFRGKDAGGVSAISWLGFSYVAFRLLHTIIDAEAGRLPPASLAEYANYVIFFPAFTAGPIERVERFLRNVNEPSKLDKDGWLEAGTRLFKGLFKKFVIADGLAWFALSDTLAFNVHSPGWMWILLYAYSLRIYFDFSGYTDIAIGLARFLGARLPENFDAPYLKPNLTQFWNSWHMTLTQWFRSYFFNPLTRFLRSRNVPVPQWVMIFFAQTMTMALIGLWHGVTFGFLLWGLWHGFGLFIQNRWSDLIRSRLPAWGRSRFGAQILNYSGIFLTFHFVTLGWLFFFLPEPVMAWNVMRKLFGVA